MSDTPPDPARQPAPPRPEPDTDPVYESWAFACLTCGHGWERTFRIEHRLDSDGQPTVAYSVEGRRVPSPLARPTCENCGGHRIRLLRAGTVAAVDAAWPDGHPPAG